MKQNKAYKIYRAILDTIRTLMLIAFGVWLITVLLKEGKVNNNENDRLHKSSTNKTERKFPEWIKSKFK